MINKVILVGNLGDDPEYKDVGGGLLRLSVATNKRWTDRETGEVKEHTEWHRVSYFNKSAHKIQDYLRRGSRVYVEGELETRSWEDDQGGKRYSTEIKARELKMLDPKGGGAGAGRQRQETRGAPAPDDDDIPF